jgi:hypothetical protein
MVPLEFNHGACCGLQKLNRTLYLFIFISWGNNCWHRTKKAICHKNVTRGILPMLRNLILLILNTWVAQLDNPCKTKWWYMLSPPQRLLKNMKFFKSLCGGESIHCMFITYLGFHYRALCSESDGPQMYWCLCCTACSTGVRKWYETPCICHQTQG